MTKLAIKYPEQCFEHQDVVMKCLSHEDVGIQKQVCIKLTLPLHRSERVGIVIIMYVSVIILYLTHFIKQKLTCHQNTYN